MKNIILILVILTNLSTVLNGQTLLYDITSNDKNIGEMTVKKVVENGTTKIEILSEVNVDMFININIKFILSVSYNKNELVYASASTYLNEKLHSSNITEKKDTYYLITKDGQTSKLINNIYYSTATLYWKEPVYLKNIYSETDNIIKQVEKTETDHYQVKIPDDNRISKYYYENGVLIKAIIPNSLMTFELTKK